MQLSPAQKKQVAEALRQRLGRPPQDNALSVTPVSTFDRLLLARGFHEVAGCTAIDTPAALAFALIAVGLGQLRGPLFIGFLPGEEQERGALYGHGLAGLGLDPARVILLAAPSEKALLWAAEDAASCGALGAVVIVLGRKQKLYGFNASRRLKLRQKKSGVLLFVIGPKSGEPTAAPARWRVASSPSLGIKAPGAALPLLGAPRFRVILDRYTGLPPQEWEIEFDAVHGLRAAARLSLSPLDVRRDLRKSA